MGVAAPAHAASCRAHYLTTHEDNMRHPTFFVPPLKTAATAVLLASLSGCYTTYQAPTSGPTAQIEFFDSTPEHLSLHLHNGAKECTDRVNVGGVPGKSRRTVTVPAGQPLVFTVGVDAEYARTALFAPIGVAVGLKVAGLQAKPAKCAAPPCAAPEPRQKFAGCTPTIEFTPESGHSYVFHMASNQKDCTFDFFEAAQAGINDGDAPAVAFVQREWVRGLTEAGPFCKAKR
jgi:hypothetical protein